LEHLSRSFSVLFPFVPQMVIVSTDHPESQSSPPPIVVTAHDGITTPP
jgi:hypothetical protein